MSANLLALGAIVLWASLAALGVALTHVPPLLLTGLALLIGSGIALVLAALGGAAISGTALRPLNQIAETTSRIALAEDLNQRIEGAYPNDEVGQLAETFNDMMERLQDLFRRFVRSEQLRRH